ncbi:MAG: molybdenum cofactor biosynthesis protein [Lachnospiraceae bacterium]|nr:molybdenum cofactor biosynthesis protein [Lachnospiraceae bacterium]
MGYIKAICMSSEKGTAKEQVREAEFVPNFGIKGDAHAGNWHRQISLLSSEAVEKFAGELASEHADISKSGICPGAFGENLLTEGICLKDIPCGTILRAGEVILRITQRGKECHSGCNIRKLTGDCIMPREGVFAEVIKGGILRTGEEISIEPDSADSPFRAAVITMSDRAYAGEYTDKSGPALAGLLRKEGFEVIEELVLPDDGEMLKTNLIRLADRRDADLIITTGGTGFSVRDVTPEATLAVATRNAPGIAEAIRAGSMRFTPKAMLSRGVSAIRNRTLMINFPGSPKAVEECFGIIREALVHGLGILTGREGKLYTD